MSMLAPPFGRRSALQPRFSCRRTAQVGCPRPLPSRRTPRDSTPVLARARVHACSHDTLRDAGSAVCLRARGQPSSEQP